MKHIKTYEKYDNRRKVYWIIPFDTNKFEDSIVRLIGQYSSLKEENPYSKIEIIDQGLQLASAARKDFKEEKFALIHLTFEINNNNQLIFGPKWGILPESDKSVLTNDDFIFVGFFNTTKDEYDLFTSSEKYNL